MFMIWFVGVDWFVEYIDDLEIQIIDVCMVLFGQEDCNVVQEYLNGYIFGVVFFDIEVFFDYIFLFLYMLLRLEMFVVVMCELGVNQDKYLIVYDEGNFFLVL